LAQQIFINVIACDAFNPCFGTDQLGHLIFSGQITCHGGKAIQVRSNGNMLICPGVSCTIRNVSYKLKTFNNGLNSGACDFIAIKPVAHKDNPEYTCTIFNSTYVVALGIKAA
jgi:hypothetical protein